MSILSWNVRGLGCTRKRAVIRETLQQYKTEVVFLQETKLSSVDNTLARDIWFLKKPKWVELEANGSSGGMLIFWDDRDYELINSAKGDFCLADQFQNKNDGKIWAALSIYANK